MSKKELISWVSKHFSVLLIIAIIFVYLTMIAVSIRE